MVPVLSLCVEIVLLVPLSPSGHIHSGIVSINLFFLVSGHTFLILCVHSNFVLKTGHFEYYNFIKQFLAVLTNAARNIHVEVSVWTCFRFFGYIPRSTAAESGGNPVFHFFWNCEIVWQHHLTFLPVMYEGCRFSASTPVLVSVFITAT